MFVCKICGVEVKQGQAICHKCGADVVDNHMTVCPVCGSRNSSGSRYCAKCGGILPVMRKPVCAVCGARNMPGAKYCISCGAPIAISNETHSDEDMLDARKMKQRLDNMERDRMAAVDKEIAEKRAKAADEMEAAKNEMRIVEAQREETYNQKLETLEAYKRMINELGSEDVDMLRKMSVALKDYSKYYADPYSQIDEDDIETDTYVCPACGTINPLNCTYCTNCGRNKARALLLLAKNKVKQSPPVKRKLRIIDAPEEDLNRKVTPTLEEFGQNPEAREQAPAPEKTEASEEAATGKKEQPEDFTGRGGFGGYPYWQAPYAPYPQQYAGQGGYFMAEDPNRQMPPIVQPVAFVPYVTQEQPLVQYTPEYAEPRPVRQYMESQLEPEPQPQPSATKRGKRR